jgi:hypothetical protein
MGIVLIFHSAGLVAGAPIGGGKVFQSNEIYFTIVY